MPRKPGTPTYRTRGTRAVVTLYDLETGARRDITLGAAGTPESHEQYHRVVAEWMRDGRRLPPRENEVLVTAGPAAGLSVAELCDQWWVDRQTRPLNAGDRGSIRLAVDKLCDHYGHLPAVGVGPNALRALRAAMTKGGKNGNGWSRSFIAKTMGIIKRIFTWGVAHELIPATVMQAQAALEPIRAGTEGFREGRIIKPAPAYLIEASLPFLPPELRAVIRLQQLTGGRPSEILGLKVGDFETAAVPGVWTVRLGHHKNSHRGKSRTLIFGPQAQAELKPFLDRDPGDYLFSPDEVMARRRAERTAQRKTPFGQGNEVGTNRAAIPRRSPGDRYNATSYNRAVSRACQFAFPPPEHLRRAKGENRGAWKARLGPERWRELLAWEAEHHWHPYQLRHESATNIRKACGLEGAAVVLGHSSALLTDQVYAERDLEKAAEIMRKIG